MKIVIRTGLLIFLGVLFSTLGPLHLLGPILGFPVICASSFLVALFMKKNQNALTQSLLMLTVQVFVFVSLFFAESWLSMLAVGMAVHVIGIVAWIAFSPLIIKKIVDQNLIY